MTPEQKLLISRALSLHQAGDLDAAINLYKEALKIEPAHSDTLLFTAIAYCQQNEYAAAAELFSQISPADVEANPNYFINYGLTLSETGEIERAITMLNKGSILDPEAFEPHFNLGRCYFKTNRFAEAEATFSNALVIEPNDGQALAYQGAVYIELGNTDQGLDLLQRAFNYSSETAFIRYNIGSAFEKQGNTAEAQKQYERAITLDEKNLLAHLGLIRTLAKQGDYAAAIQRIEQARSLFSTKDGAILECHLSTIAHLQGDNTKAELHAQNALGIDPESPEAYGLLALAYSNTSRQIEAVELFKKAAAAAPASQMHLINMSKNYTAIGMTEEAIATAQQAFAIDTASSAAFSSLLLYLHYPSNIPAAEIASLHKQYGEIFSNKAPAGWRQPIHPKSRRAKIGFISGDFCIHPIQFFIEPLLKEIKAEDSMDVVLFSNTPKKDQVTERLIYYSNKLIDIRHLDDQSAYKIIQDEELDALIDLSGHTNHNRLPLLAMKPARIQLTYLGYPDTTGLTEIDYRLTDNYADPIERAEDSSETLCRLENCFLNYLPPEYPEIDESASTITTFGSFNNIAKISAETIRIWSEILQRVANSRLLLKCHGLSAADLQKLLTPKFTALGIEAQRLIFADRQPQFLKHLGLYNSIDIALDTYPYNGTTTTFEALLMGRPVITLAGTTHVSSVGKSILSNMELPELIATNPAEYIEKAVNLSQDSQVLQRYHTTLRQQLLDSKLCDSKLFYKKFIEALEKIGIIQQQ